MRTALLTEKIGMTRVFYEDGTSESATILRFPKSKVVKTFEKEGQNFVKIASFIDEKSVGKLNKPQLDEVKALNIKKSARLNDFKVSKDALIKTGQELHVRHFTEGQYVDVQSISKGKGFAGGMKRHGFGGLEATHGVSISHRSHGSTGQCQDPGRVFKGKKMAGHLGDSLTTIQNLRVLDIDTENQLIVVEGSVPGKKGGFVKIQDSVKKALTSNIPFPTYYDEKKVEDNNEKNTESINKDNSSEKTGKQVVANSEDKNNLANNTENKEDK